MAEISFEPYTGQSKLRFWCQKVLPLVYDESLSYYELLCKVVEYLNNTITDVSACEDNITALRDAFVQLQDYVNERIEDFAPEVEQIIDDMIDSGEFDEILAGVVNGLIANDYSTTQGYAQFDYVLKDGKLYCATASTSGEWDETKWRETTVGSDMQLLNQRVYNLNAGQVAFNEATTYENNTVGKKLKDLDDFDDNLHAGQVAFDESASYGNNTVGKKLKDLDTFDDNLNAGQVAYNSADTYGNATVGKELQDLNTELSSIHKVYYSIAELGLPASPKPTLSAVALAMENGSQAVLTNTEIDETELTQNLNLATVILIYRISAVRIFAFGARSYAAVNLDSSRLFYASFNSNQSLWYGWKEIAWKDITTYEVTNIFTGLNTPVIKSQNNVVSVMVNALSGGATLSLAQSWNTLFQLPTEIRPSANFRFPIADYSDGVTFYQGQITTGGVVRIYMPTAKTINPEFAITYLI